MPKEKTEAPILKRRLSDYPGHVLLLQQQGEVQLKNMELDIEAQRLSVMLANQHRPLKVFSRAAKAVMVKLGMAAEADGELSIQELTEMLAGVKAERQGCNELLGELQRRREILETELSREICSGLEDEHKVKIAKRICDAAIELARANEAERLWFEDLAADSVRTAGYLQPMAVPGIGQLADRESNVRRHLKAAHEYGIPGLEQLVTDPPIPRGPVVKVKLLTNMASAEGHYPVGSVIQSDIAGYLIQKRYATLAGPGDKVTPIRRAPQDGKWGWHPEADWR